MREAFGILARRILRLLWFEFGIDQYADSKHEGRDAMLTLPTDGIDKTKTADEIPTLATATSVAIIGKAGHGQEV